MSEYNVIVPNKHFIMECNPLKHQVKNSSGALYVQEYTSMHDTTFVKQTKKREKDHSTNPPDFRPKEQTNMFFF